MSDNSRQRTLSHEDSGREQRLADLSGALAKARLTHQVKELEQQKAKQEKLIKPVLKPINAVVYVCPISNLTIVTPES